MNHRGPSMFYCTMSVLKKIRERLLRVSRAGCKLHPARDARIVMHQSMYEGQRQSSFLSIKPWRGDLFLS